MHARTARLPDADALADLNVRAWQRAYRGVMPDAYLDGLSVTDRIGLWHEVLGDPPRRSGQLVVEEAGRVAGFVWGIDVPEVRYHRTLPPPAT